MSNPIENENRAELAKGYEHREVEARWYPFWQERGYFHGDEHDRSRPPFSIVLPPPNVTGSLHLGPRPHRHAAGRPHPLEADERLQHALAPRHRSRGHRHADDGREGAEEDREGEPPRPGARGVPRAGLGVEGASSGRASASSTRRWAPRSTGSASASPWTPGSPGRCARSSSRLYEEGLIYREQEAHQLVPATAAPRSPTSRWSTRRRTPASSGTSRYPLADGAGEIRGRHHPAGDDAGRHGGGGAPRRRALPRASSARQVRHPLLDREIPIVADAILVDPKFGTGAVKVTPAHDFNDFEVGQRHGLEQINVIGLDGRMNEAAGPLRGAGSLRGAQAGEGRCSRRGARSRGSKPHALPLGRCQRCAPCVEPLLSRPVVREDRAAGASPAIEAVEDGRTALHPRAVDQHLHDVDAEHPRLVHHPAALVGPPHPGLVLRGCGDVTVAREDARRLPARAAATSCARTTDVLDTWFSSGLWPFSTMGWPEQTAELRPSTRPPCGDRFRHPLLLGGPHDDDGPALHGEVPFRDVYIHPWCATRRARRCARRRGT